MIGQKLKSVLLFSLCVLPFLSFAQQKAQFSQYMLNNYLFNPAVAGSEDYVDIKSGYRTQWAGVTDAPKTFYVSGHAPVGKPKWAATKKNDGESWHGMGGLVYNDQTGPTSKTSMYGSYSYNLALSPSKGYGMNKKEGIRLSLGTFIGFQQYRVDTDQLETLEPGDLAVSGGGVQTQLAPDASFGAKFYFRDIFYVGLSAFQLFESSLRMNELTKDSKLARHYFVNGGVKLQMSEEFYMIPSVLAKVTQAAPASVDVNLRADYKDKYYGGVSYRHGDALAVMLGLVLDYRFEFGYSYDITTSALNAYSNGTHEFVLGYRIIRDAEVRNPNDFW